MKATDKQLLDICTELTAHIITPTDNLNLSRDECIILNRLITEEFERREEQDVMGSSDRQDTSLGQSGADNNDVTLDASECRDSEVSGVEVRKKKPQITKVSKKEYWDNIDNHGMQDYLEHSEKIVEKSSEVTEAVDKLITGTRGDELAEKRKTDDDDSIPIAWLKSEIEETRELLKTETNEKIMHDQIAYIVGINSIIDYWGWFGKNDWEKKEGNTNETTNETSDYPVGSFGYERERLANEVEDILEKNGINPNETTDEITQLDDLKDTEKINNEIKVSKGAMVIDIYKIFGSSFEDKCISFGGTRLLDKYIPVAWMKERIKANDNMSDTPYADNYRKVIDSWEAFGKDSWYQNRHYDPSVYFETTN